MPVTTNFGKGSALPLNPKYCHWSKEFIESHVGRDTELTAYIHIDPSYQVNSNMLALYEFQRKPLLNQFKSVVIDREQGIILSKRSSQALINDLIKNHFLAGLTFQKEIAQRLNFKSHYVLATGRLAYFSTHGYTTGNTDWLSLHQMVNYQVSEINRVKFKSLPINGLNYTFEFVNCGRYIKRKISDSLYYNYVLSQLGQAHLENILGWNVVKKRSQSLLDKAEYYLPHFIHEPFTIRDIWNDVLQHKYLKYGECMADLFELQLIREDHYFVYRLSRRGDNLF
ncbi:hypothetical protein PT285_01870 [Lactobacillus sp. ESL0791]|uniref:hypothetical protein n=1 Tax=Lactobacillus sp. ESL0791 TaxID=2983234 RepID=UPI0023F63F94|nr:hypothetical protein [Lactobacillus sp. ESL0791]MDF7638184.1 hypothetical protein [Lactobacillus sp. ESL0791]